MKEKITDRSWPRHKVGNIETRKLGEGATPGPWRMLTRSALHGSNMEWIATIHDRANARLIAKAPLLVEARDEIQRWHDVIQAHFATPTTIEGRTATAMMNRMRALLAKLESED